MNINKIPDFIHHVRPLFPKNFMRNLPPLILPLQRKHLQRNIMSLLPPRNYSLRILLLLALLWPLGWGCSDTQETPIPDVYVNIVINPASIEYGNLKIPGNYALIKGGYRGIIVYHYMQDEYIAYERTCTYDWDKPCSKLVMDPSGLIARDTCCGSAFLIIDGTPMEGSKATLPLKRYKTYYDANYGRLYITN